MAQPVDRHQLWGQLGKSLREELESKGLEEWIGLEHELGGVLRWVLLNYLWEKVGSNFEG